MSFCLRLCYTSPLLYLDAAWFKVVLVKVWDDTLCLRVVSFWVSRVEDVGTSTAIHGRSRLECF